MKLIFTFLFFAISISVFAQVIPFPTKNATWVYYQIGDFGGLPVAGSQQTVEYIGDTVINNVEYGILTNPHPYSEKNAFIREEDNRVYLLPPDSTEDTGDVFPFHLH